MKKGKIYRNILSFGSGDIIYKNFFQQRTIKLRSFRSFFLLIFLKKFVVLAILLNAIVAALLFCSCAENASIRLFAIVFRLYFNVK